MDQLKIAALYDIHGNLPALEAVLEKVLEMEVDAIVVGGDVFLGPMPNETLANLDALKVPVQYIMGNCDRLVLEFLDGHSLNYLPKRIVKEIEWVATILDKRYVPRIQKWEKTTTIYTPRHGEIFFCHATPDSDEVIFTEESKDFLVTKLFNLVDANFIVCGHTHIQMDRTIGKKRILNAGSVGMSFEGLGAFWLLIEEEPQLMKTSYNYKRASTTIRRTEYPNKNEFIEKNILKTLTKAEMISLYEKQNRKS